MAGAETIAQDGAAALLHGLVAIPSLSRQESQAAHWLVEQMATHGFGRAFVDGAGNAVGEMGAADAAQTVILLGHIDTVPGDIPVRVENGLLYGRGSVDAKGPLATFVGAVARLGDGWARANDLRLVVVGAVEEEYATSKGARFIRDRFNGAAEPIPTACIIGEPSSWQRVTLGYKGRVLIEIEASQPMAHTAGPDAGVATVVVDLWNWVSAYAAAFNTPYDKAFDQLLPSLRDLRTWTDEKLHDRVEAKIGVRLPVDFPIDGFLAGLVGWANQRTATETPLAPSAHAAPEPDREGGAAIGDGAVKTVEIVGPLTQISLRIYAHEPAWRGDRNNALVRAFLSAIREVSGERPSFVVKTGTSDMNVVGPAWGCPILAYGPGDSSLDHTPNEHISLDEYWQAVLVLEQALRNLAAIGDRGSATGDR